MVTRVHGNVKSGVWFSANVRFMTVTVTGMTAQADLADPNLANSTVERVVEALATRGTVIGVHATAETVIQVMVDYGQAYDDADVLTEVEALIDADAALSAAAITNVGVEFQAV